MCLDLGGRHGELRSGPTVTHDVEDRVDPAVVMGHFPLVPLVPDGFQRARAFRGH